MSGHKVVVSCVIFFFGEQMSPEMEYFILFFLTKLEKFKLSKKSWCELTCSLNSVVTSPVQYSTHDG